MLRDTAVQRIDDAIGFRPLGTPIDAKIVLRLQEAQRDLEKGKTLPKFLINEDVPLPLPMGQHAIALPADFIRLDDDNLPHYTNLDSFLPTYLEYVRSYSDAVLEVVTLQRPGEPAMTVLAPRIFTIRNSVIDFITTADQDYALAWNYYHSGVLLTANVENEWLANSPEWLIGEAGYRIAYDLRDQDAMALFDDMRTKGRAATFGDMLADEDAGGPILMGSRN